MASSSRPAPSAFTSEPGFCTDCGSVLPSLGPTGGVECYTCHRKFGPEAFQLMEQKYTIHFNSIESFDIDKKKSGEDEADGPVVERICPKCNNDQMSYKTLQLRSADEGQTIFFSCTKCKFKETENS